MNSNDINSIINNLCDKLGTTANKLIPEMAGYQIAKHSIWLAISIIFIGVCVGLTIRLLWMRKREGKMLALYPDKVRELDDYMKAHGFGQNIASWTIREWNDVISSIPRVTGRVTFDDSTYMAWVFSAVWSGLIGIVIFGVALYHIIGWCIAPNASAFMWIINQLGGGQ